MTYHDHDRTVSRLVSLLTDASFGRGGVQTAVPAVAEMALARANPAAFVEAVESFIERLDLGRTLRN